MLNIYIIGVSEGKEKEGGAENIYEINDWKFPRFGKNLNLQIQETQRISNNINSNNTMINYIITKLHQTKKKKKFWM